MGLEQSVLTFDPCSGSGFQGESRGSNEKLNKNFIKNLTDKLLSWTGERWIISLSKNSEAKSIHEKNLEIMDNKIDEFKKSKIAKDIEINFPDAKLVEIKEE